MKQSSYNFDPRKKQTSIYFSININKILVDIVYNHVIFAFQKIIFLLNSSLFCKNEPNYSIFNYLTPRSFFLYYWDIKKTVKSHEFILSTQEQYYTCVNMLTRKLRQNNITNIILRIFSLQPVSWYCVCVCVCVYCVYTRE